ncbi:MAG: hypothetical protein K1Y02_09220 [Candidatus Hydrogenedentes bacterium]|nr:hypothetical protein [Candidatus Hydrogenedentota bacterium]
MRKTAKALVVFVLAACTAHGEEVFTSFDADPGWDGHNNRSQAFELRQIAQDFGYTAENIFGIPGAIGGAIFPDGTPAYYAMPIPESSLDTPLHAAGVLKVEKGGGNVLLGFFNNATINEWRTPNSLAFRINGRGDTFHVHTEYATSKWRAGASVIGRVDLQADRVHPIENPGDAVYRWSLDYDPAANNGAGALTATLNDVTAVMEIAPENRAEGLTVNRFGFLNVVKHADGGGRFWMADLTVNGMRIDLSADPKWDALNNRKTYLSTDVRPRFDFGFTPTHFAGGSRPGEIGGLFFRGDCRYPEKLAYYGAKCDALTLAKPLRASGKIALHRGISDSTSIFGFFHSERSIRVNPSQQSAIPEDFVGFAVEGPSAQGFFVYPLYRAEDGAEGVGKMEPTHLIYPDGKSHTWMLEYTPESDGSGAIVITFDNASTRLAIPADALAQGAEFDRFGFVTPWIDGNGQRIYVDDLAYTVRQ